MHPCRQPAESSGVGGLAASVVAGGGAREPGSGRLRRAGRSAAAVGRREASLDCLSPARKAPRSAGTQGGELGQRTQGALRVALQGGGLTVSRSRWHAAWPCARVDEVWGGGRSERG